MTNIIQIINILRYSLNLQCSLEFKLLGRDFNSVLIFNSLNHVIDEHQTCVGDKQRKDMYPRTYTFPLLDDQLYDHFLVWEYFVKGN